MSENYQPPKQIADAIKRHNEIKEAHDANKPVPDTRPKISPQAKAFCDVLMARRAAHPPKKM